MKKIRFAILLSLSIGSCQIQAQDVWVWAHGSDTLYGKGQFGTLGTPAVSNLPGSRYGGATWKDAEGNFWLFGGQGYGANQYGALNDLWKFNPETNQWTWVKGSKLSNDFGSYGTKGTASAANLPASRSDAVTWVDANGNLWLFGGIDPSAELNDLWKYNVTANQWTWMKGSSATKQAGIYGTKGVEAAANTPGARDNAVSWTDKTGNLWLFGGSSNNGLLNDLWKYNVSTNNWTWVGGSNITNQVGVYGTKGTPSAANVPGAREGAVSWTDKDGHLWLFGGSFVESFSKVVLNDAWKYNIATGQWTWIKGANTTNAVGSYGVKGTSNANNTPGARAEAASWTDAEGQLWLFGGGTGYGASSGGRLSDLWRLDPASQQWVWLSGPSSPNSFGNYQPKGTINANSTPGGRGRPMTWADGNGKLWLFGGWGYAKTSTVGPLNDLWKFGTFLNTETEESDVSSDKWMIYPNPSEGLLKMDLKRPTEIAIYGPDGTEIRNEIAPSGLYSIDLSNYSPGIYLVKAQLNGQATLYKLIKK